MTEQIQLGSEARSVAANKKKSLEDAYKAYNPKISDLTYYFFNVFQDDGKYSPLIGEAPNAITAIVSFFLGKRPVMIRSWAGTGKTVIANAVWSLAGEDMRYQVEMGSATALWNQTAAINEVPYIWFNELQNSADNSEVEKVLKLWGEGRDANRSVTDVTQGRAGEDRTVDTVLTCKPFFTTVAVENVAGKKITNDEFNRRIIDLYTDVSEIQTANVIKYMLNVYSQGVNQLAKMSETQRAVLKLHIKKSVEASQLVKEYRFPGAVAMANQIPVKFVQSRSALPQFFSVINSFAVFNYKNRIITSDGTMLITPEDLYLASVCYGKRFAQKCFNMEMLADELLQIFPKVKNPGSPSRNEMLNEAEVKKNLKNLKINIPTKKLKNLLESFSDSGIIEVRENETLENETLYWKSGIDEFDNTFKYPEIIEECKRVVRENYPQYAEDYIKRFCNVPVVEHPIEPHTVNLITGEKVVINRGWGKLVE